MILMRQCSPRDISIVWTLSHTDSRYMIPTKVKYRQLISTNSFYHGLPLSHIAEGVSGVTSISSLKYHPMTIKFGKTEVTWQGCALDAPSGPWSVTFPPRQLKNFSILMGIICRAPWVSQVRGSGVSYNFS